MQQKGRSEKSEPFYINMTLKNSLLDDTNYKHNPFGALGGIDWLFDPGNLLPSEELRKLIGWLLSSYILSLFVGTFLTAHSYSSV